MWRQAADNMVVLAPLAGNGWIKEDGKFLIDWDSKDNMHAVRQRVDLLLKGVHASLAAKQRDVVAKKWFILWCRMQVCKLQQQ